MAMFEHRISPALTAHDGDTTVVKHYKAIPVPDIEDRNRGRGSAADRKEARAILDLPPRRLENSISTTEPQIR